MLHLWSALVLILCLRMCNDLSLAVEVNQYEVPDLTHQQRTISDKYVERSDKVFDTDNPKQDILSKLQKKEVFLQSNDDDSSRHFPGVLKTNWIANTRHYDPVQHNFPSIPAVVSKEGINIHKPFWSSVADASYRKQRSEQHAAASEHETRLNDEVVQTSVRKVSEFAAAPLMLRVTKRSDGSSPEFVFPDQRFLPNVGEGGPKCANGSTFCVDADEYPSGFVVQALRRKGDNVKELLSDDGIDDLMHRMGEPGETKMCSSKEQIIYPKLALSKDEEWRFIVNEGEYKQGFKVETCLKEDSPCTLSEVFPEGYQAICRQKYIFRKMVALNGDGRTYSDQFQLPSCCACYLKSALENRIGSSQGRKNSTTKPKPPMK